MATTHILAPEHLPRYIGTADGGDPLFTVVTWLVLILLMVVGNLYLKLHALPERMAHRQNNTQLQVVMVLALLALLTHNNIFWVGALLLTVVRFPDFSTPITSIADSLSKLTEQLDSESRPELADTETPATTGTDNEKEEA